MLMYLVNSDGGTSRKHQYGERILGRTLGGRGCVPLGRTEGIESGPLRSQLWSNRGKVIHEEVQQRLDC